MKERKKKKNIYCFSFEMILTGRIGNSFIAIKYF